MDRRARVESTDAGVMGKTTAVSTSCVGWRDHDSPPANHGLAPDDIASSSSPEPDDCSYQKVKAKVIFQDM